MSATGGMGWTGCAALMLAAASLAAGLTGCEYEDDAGPAPAASDDPSLAYPSAAPVLTRDPELVAAESRHLLQVEALLGSPAGLLFGGSGGIGDTRGGGLSSSGIVSRTGRYTVTAACLGAPDAFLTVSQGAHQGGTLLALNISCGGSAELQVDLAPGVVSAHLARARGGVPGPGTGAAAGIRISYTGPGQ